MQWCVFTERGRRSLTWAAIDGVDPVDHRLNMIAVVPLGGRVGVEVEGCGSGTHSPACILLEAIVVLQARAEWLRQHCNAARCNWCMGLAAIGSLLP